jgi:hypothetical protein
MSATRCLTIVDRYSLEQATPRDDERSAQRAVVRARARAAFASEGLSLPTPDETARSAAFVQPPRRPAASRPADVIAFLGGMEPRSV